MNRLRPNGGHVCALLAAAMAASPALLADDFGADVERRLHDAARTLFGIERPLAASAPASLRPYRAPEQTAVDQVAVAPDLKVEYLTRAIGDVADMLAFWPNDTAPTHLIVSIEAMPPRVLGLWPNGLAKLTPSVQRIDLASGKIDTVLRGMAAADGIRRTPWGTVLVAEETPDGGAYEIIDPLTTTDHTVVDRTGGLVLDATGWPSDSVAKRPMLPAMAWEGLTLLDNGVLYAGDEALPGEAGADADGGSLYKFVPTRPYTGDAITHLDQSPLVQGDVYALQVSCLARRQQTGQGCEVGNAAWIAVAAGTARAQAHARGATGYFRPEDLERDPRYRDAAHPDAVRVCWTNTGSAAAQHYGEVLCAVDRAPWQADADARSVTVQRFIEGDAEFNAFDNLAFQPGTGNLYVLEDAPNGDVYACLPDGTDRDDKSDGCVRVMSVRDSSAEPTGLIFSADGATAYLVIQHSDDGLMPEIDGYGTDDIVKITGFDSIAPRAGRRATAPTR